MEVYSQERDRNQGDSLMEAMYLLVYFSYLKSPSRVRHIGLHTEFRVPPQKTVDTYYPLYKKPFTDSASAPSYRDIHHLLLDFLWVELYHLEQHLTSNMHQVYQREKGEYSGMEIGEERA